VKTIVETGLPLRSQTFPVNKGSGVTASKAIGKKIGAGLGH